MAHQPSIFPFYYPYLRENSDCAFLKFNFSRLKGASGGKTIKLTPYHLAELFIDDKKWRCICKTWK